MLFGAGVLPDGRPSATLARRTGYAAAAAEADPGADIFCSGGQGRYGAPEARVMASLLEGTIARDRIILDEESADTLQNVTAAVAYARAHGYEGCLSCTDAYHQPRVLMLFRMFGMPARRIRFARVSGGRYVARMRMREAAAIPYDLVAGLWHRLRSGE